MGSHGARLALVCGIAFAVLACSQAEQNPVFGDWEIDRNENRRGVLLAVEATDLTTLSLRDGVIAAGVTEIPVEYVVEEDRVRAVRQDGRGEHLIEILADGRIRVDLPIGVTVVYRKAGA